MKKLTGIIERIGGKIQRDRRRRLVLRTVPHEGVCAEIGVWKGDFSRKILRTTRPKRLHLIDPWKFETGADKWWGGELAKSQADMDKICQSVRRRFQDVPAVEIHRVNSSAGEALFPDEYFDWVYIDGDHSYGSVLSDLELFFRKVKTEGYLAGDDLLFKGLPGYPVMRAVVDFLRDAPVEIVYASRCQYILRKRFPV